MAGLPPPIALRKLIPALFQNLRYSYDKTSVDPVVKTFFFAEGTLSADQLAQIAYPVGFTPLNFYIIYQINLTQDQYRTFVVPFAEKDGYIYGIYYQVTANAPILDRCVIQNSRRPLTLPDDVVLESRLYLELYVYVGSTPVILGLDTRDTPTASLQYGIGSRYFTADLTGTGLETPSPPKVRKIGLSRSLQSDHCR